MAQILKLSDIDANAFTIGAPKERVNDKGNKYRTYEVKFPVRGFITTGEVSFNYWPPSAQQNKPSIMIDIPIEVDDSLREELTDKYPNYSNEDHPNYADDSHSYYTELFDAGIKKNPTLANLRNIVTHIGNTFVRKYKKPPLPRDEAKSYVKKFVDKAFYCNRGKESCQMYFSIWGSNSKWPTTVERQFLDEDYNLCVKKIELDSLIGKKCDGTLKFSKGMITVTSETADQLFFKFTINSLFVKREVNMEAVLEQEILEEQKSFNELSLEERKKLAEGQGLTMQPSAEYMQATAEEWVSQNMDDGSPKAAQPGSVPTMDNEEQKEVSVEAFSFPSDL